MKFGKRLASEASRKWSLDVYFDYKSLKKAIKDDIAAADASGTRFQAVLQAELQKVSRFYSERANMLEAMLERARQTAASAELAAVKSEVKELKKFVALNYVAVVKSIKKRNRHLKETFGGAANTSLHALDLLGSEVFFTSPRLAQLATHAEVLEAEALAARRSGGEVSTSDMLADYECPVCLETLHNPVVLTCAHRFCWGCLVAHCTTARDTPLPFYRQQQKVLEDMEADNSAIADAETAEALLQSSSAAATPPAAASTSSAASSQDGSSGDDRNPAHGDQRRAAANVAAAAAAAAGAPSRPGAHQHRAASPPVAVPATAAGKEAKEPLLSRCLGLEDDDLLETARFYDCPVCRKPQILDIDSLQVDTFLGDFIDDLQRRGDKAKGKAQVGALPSGAAASAAATPPPLAKAPPSSLLPAAPGQYQGGIIPPKSARHAGRLTVLLDLDGTLVSSYTPKRAPRLPPSVRTHLVGRGSKLNPQGVFVVERPGLQEFLTQLADWAEVIVFTAGLQDYAKPIIDAIDPAGAAFAHIIYRNGTLRTEHYQCVKDMSRLNRDLKSTVLVDDTPLAFLHQPDNGIPVLGFRGDPDDRLLMEAVMPLLQSLAKEADVRALLQRRFDMCTWFKRNGFPLDQILERVARKQFVLQAEVQAEAAAGALAAAGGIAGCAATATASGLLSPAGPPPLVDLSPQQPALPMRDTLLLCDFDKTLIDFDACERLIEDLAPELLPAMVSLEEPACFVPITNSILGEVCRRGMGREALVAALQRLGAEVPPASLQLLRLAKQRQGVDVRILSDCNSVFIHHILQAVNALPLVDEVITNAAHFVRVGGEDGGTVSMPVELGAAKAAASLDIRSARQGGSSSNGGDAAAAPCGSQHKLVIQPLHAGPQPHGCPRCPSNLCKGAQVRKLRGRQPYRRIVYCGDGANDICAALHLGPGDVVLARQGYALAQFLTQQQAQRPQAPFRLWATHQELLTLVQQQLLAAP